MSSSQPNRTLGRSFYSLSDSNVTYSLSPIGTKPTRPTEHTRIPIWLSVFFGIPDPWFPRLDHARFSSNVAEVIFETTCATGDSPTKDSFDRSSTNSSIPPFERQSSQTLEPFHELVCLSMSVEDMLLTCIEGSCRICQDVPPETFVYLPLCATKNGYGELDDFAEMYRLMSIIASHTAHIGRQNEVNWSIGSFVSDRPYVCLLAVPICLEDTNCHEVATEMCYDYVHGILEGRIQRYVLEDDPPPPQKEQNITTSWTSTTSSCPSNEDGDVFEDARSRASSPEKSADKMPPEKNLPHSIGLTSFIGGSSLLTSDGPSRGSLGCLVFASMWRHVHLPGYPNTIAQDIADYCHIACFYDQQILVCADFRCAVCPEPNPATRLVHMPLSFARTDKFILEESPVRDLVTKVGQCVIGKWRFPDLKAALGAECQAQLFDLAVPICECNTSCENVAHASAAAWIKVLLSNTQISTQTDSDMNPSDSEIDLSGDTEPMAEETELLFQRLAPHLLMQKDADEEPEELLFSAAEKEELDEVETGSSTGVSMGENHYSEEDSSIGGGESWIYTPGQRINSTTDSENLDEDCRRADECVTEEIDRILLFQPLLNMEFWTLQEALAQLSPLRPDDSEWETDNGTDSHNDGDYLYYSANEGEENSPGLGI